MKTNAEPRTGAAEAARFRELVEQVRADSPSAAAMIVATYSPALLFMIQGQVLRRGDALRDHFDTFDLLQEGWKAFFTSVQHGNIFPDERALFGFVLRVATHRCSDFIRTHSHAGARKPRDVPFNLKKHDRPSRAPGPAEKAEIDDECAAALAKLPELHAAVIKLRAKGYKTREIAKEMHLSLRKAQRIIKRTQDSVNGHPSTSPGVSPMAKHSDLAQAEKANLRLVEDNPNNAAAWYQLGLIAIEQRQYPVGIERFERAAALDPRLHACQHKLGICHQALGQLDQALTHFTRFAKLVPGDVDGACNIGLVLAQLGRREEAAAAFEKALRIQPGSHVAHGNLGSLLAETRDFAGAEQQFRLAIKSAPNYAEGHRNLAVAFKMQGKLDEAVAACRLAVAADPRNVLAHQSLADTLRQLDRLDEALAAYRQMQRAVPAYPSTPRLIAQVLNQQGKPNEALAILQQNLLHRPDSPETFIAIAQTLLALNQLDDASAACGQAIRYGPQLVDGHFFLGISLLRQTEFPQACAAFRQAISLAPTMANAHANLGSALLHQELFDEAMAALAETVRLEPKHVEAHHNLGTAYRRLGRVLEAIPAYQRAIELNPNHAEAHSGLGAAYLQNAQPEEAIVSFERAIELAPMSAEYHTNISLALLGLGHYERGLEEYEWRLKMRNVQPRTTPQPVWDGTPLPRGTILVYAEQGLGDTLMCVRYLRMVRQRVGKVLFECPTPLRTLIANCAGVDLVTDPAGPAPPADVQIPFLSLPRIFGTRLDTIPAHTPYLVADPALMGHWRTELQTHENGSGRPLRVGIVWQGNVKHPGDPFRSVKIERFAPLAAVPGVKLYSLQKGPGSEQLGPDQSWVTDLGGQARADFADTAAAMACLDLVISVDTSVVHLAGALGREAWVMVPFSPDWRWLRDGERTPWYPTLRLFRQPRFGDWDSVMERIVTELTLKAATRPQQHYTVELTATEIAAMLRTSTGDLRDKLQALMPMQQAA